MRRPFLYLKMQKKICFHIPVSFLVLSKFIVREIEKSLRFFSFIENEKNWKPCFLVHLYVHFHAKRSLHYQHIFLYFAYFLAFPSTNMIFIWVIGPIRKKGRNSERIFPAVVEIWASVCITFITPKNHVFFDTHIWC